MMRRELGAYFLSPIAYVVIAIFLFTAGLAFGLGTFIAGKEASLRPLFDFWIVLILVFAVYVPLFPAGGTASVGPDHNPTVHIHRGVIGDDNPLGGPSDLDARVHTWQGPVAKLVIRVEGWPYTHADD
jgi:hypothetical protein